jgi:GTPase SAR1 family protein
MTAPLVILTGASGAGKTTIARRFLHEHSADCDVLFFDSIGVPGLKTMQSEFGGAEAWQRTMTLRSLERIKPALSSGRPMLFEGQMRIAFIHDALAAQAISNARVILIDCDDATRTARLHLDRTQPDLANPTMMNWARYLRDEAHQFGAEILDTSHKSLEESVAILKRYLFNSAQAADI